MRAGMCLVLAGVVAAWLALAGADASDPLNWMCTMDACRVTVETPHGTVWSSNPVDLDDLDTDYFAFKGIPYAASTAGENRWKAPQDVEPWPRNASIGAEWGPICPQTWPEDNSLSDTLDFYGNSANVNWTSVVEERTMGEDCLVLNVFSPSQFNATSNLPVMVWIHGGGLVEGSGQDYPPQGIVSEDMVLVTINYRLGLLGYFAHPELNETNFGLLDQVKALEWVRDNIAAFGGNPGQVTIFGESAGGLSVLGLLTTPLAEGLFQNAIASSSGFVDSAPNVTMAKAGVLGVAVGEGLNISSGAGQLEQMRALPADAFVKELPSLQNGTEFDLANIYIEEKSMPTSIFEAFDTGAFHNGVNLMIGTNANETSFFYNPDSPKRWLSTPQAYQSYVDRVFGTNADGVFASLPVASNDEQQKNASIQLTTDILFGIPSYWVAEALAQSPGTANVYLYQYSFAPPGFELGATHGADVAQMFNASITAVVGDMRYFAPVVNQDLADTMVTYVTNFAKTGNPNAPNDWFDMCQEEVCELLPKWEEYNGNGTWQVLDNEVGPQPIPASTLQIYEWGKDLYPMNCLGGNLVGNGECWANQT